MKNIILPKKDINLYEHIYSGAHAKCIIYDKNTALKLWYVPSNINTNDFERFFELNDDFFKFPRGYVFDENGNIIGFSMSLATGKRLQELPEDTKISDIIKAYKNSLIGLLNISEKAILSYDLSENNIIFNEKFNFVDTDTYTFLENAKDNISTCLKTNFYEFVNTLFLFFISQNEKIMNIVYRDSDLNDMYINYSLGYPFHFDLFLEMFIDRLNKKLDTSIETFGNLKETQYIYSKR